MRKLKIPLGNGLIATDKLKARQARRRGWIGVVGFCLVLLLPVTASADSLTGKVVKITDGDTLYVLDANYKDHKIRLAGIDAPERKQAYGLASRKHLASIVAGQQREAALECPELRWLHLPLQVQRCLYNLE